MRTICFFVGDITRCGGTEKVSTIIANEIVLNKNYRVMFLSLVEQNNFSYFSISADIKRYVLNKKGKWIEPGPGYLFLIPELRRFLKRQSIDIIIDVDIVLDALTIPASVGMAVKVISWEHFHFYFEQKFLYRKMISRFSSLFSDYIITLTRQDKENYKKNLHRIKKIDFIYNPITVSKNRNSLECSKGVFRKNILITVGRIEEIKGADLIIKILPRILSRHKDWQWFFLGEGDYKGDLEEAVHRYQLEEQVVLTGNVSNVEDYLKCASIFVMTSRSEGLPMCLLEAKAAGLPCVAFDIQTGPSEIIQNEVNGFLVPSFDLDKMVEKIELLIKSEELRNRFANNTVIGMEKFQIDFILRKWAYVLENV